ncbi:hypothetical protein GJU40_12865 [Bacillus lacus]|uniref:Uncharacterized protein n=1 Tax=Metabacillus lacus TaxID=1983721 RepID=A0A7X2J1N5_9BACI|nr:hypothetical protein [Metabacillus lacus]MRX73033.1 hypothetical protein [Metabacillus lacus]
MFLIKYNIPNEGIDDIIELDESSFDDEYGEIYGQFELNFNEYKQGFVHEEIPFGNELLISWFKLINKVVLTLNTNDYVAFPIMETDDYWIELICKEDLISVKKVKDNHHKRTLYEFIITKPFEEFSDEWKTTDIKRLEFINEVKLKTKQFIKDVATINKNLLKSQSLNELVLINQKL